MSDPVQDIDPVAALASMDRARAAMLERVGQGSWRYDLIYSALAAGAIGGQGLPIPLNAGVNTAAVMALVVLARWWRARTGFWISGVAPQRARWVAIAVGLVIGTAMIAAAVMARRGMPLVAIPLALTGGLAALVGSRAWRRVYRSEVEAGELPDVGRGFGSGLSAFTWPVMALGVVSVIAAVVLAVLGIDSYIVGIFAGVGVAFLAMPALMALKRRLLAR